MKQYKTIVIISAIGLTIFLFIFFITPVFGKNTIQYSAKENTAQLDSGVTAATEAQIVKKVVAHIETPVETRGIYMSGYVASSKKIRDNVLKLFDNSTLNTIVIDIKDYRGKLFFNIDDPVISDIGSVENNIKDISEFIQELHSKNIYVIGRVSSFQDSYLAKSRPEYAVTRSDMKTVWKDRKGVMWVDPGNEKVWEYLKTVGEKSYDIGFDEINFDYIRFPSDGDMKDIYFPKSEERFTKQIDGKTVRFAKSDVIMEFFKYLSAQLKPKGIKISADVFGMTTSNKDDLGIGQVFEKIVPYVDYISPMVYPSHYPANWSNIKNPEASPYATIKKSMSDGINKLSVINESSSKLRPWIQDFSLKVTYGQKEVQEQIRALDEIGIKSYLVWDASNKYTPQAYKLTTNTTNENNQ
jgi:hypothetical protein